MKSVSFIGFQGRSAGAKLRKTARTFAARRWSAVMRLRASRTSGRPSSAARSCAKDAKAPSLAARSGANLTAHAKGVPVSSGTGMALPVWVPFQALPSSRMSSPPSPVKVPMPRSPLSLSWATVIAGSNSPSITALSVES